MTDSPNRGQWGTRDEPTQAFGNGYPPGRSALGRSLFSQGLARWRDSSFHPGSGPGYHRMNVPLTLAIRGIVPKSSDICGRPGPGPMPDPAKELYRLK